MASKERHLWRSVRSAPFTRYACTIVEDSAVPDGYRITDFDPNVADGGFLHQLATRMSRAATVRASHMEGDKRLETIRSAMPHEHGHFEAAVRSIPGANLCAVGRA